MILSKTLALVLAGGAGSRLEVLTAQRAKPAMPFAGVFRLIDVPLSNLSHSGISNVWVIEQYRPHSLNEHLANGRPWDLDRTHGGLRILPPYEGSAKEGFAEGNADAIYQHIQFIREYDPELILVLSADHLYRLDYSKVIEQHQARDADLTMVTTEVARDEASRFGVVQADDEGRVTGFEYKPDEPKSRIVTAEVFLYRADVLLDTLEQLAKDEGESGLEDYGDQLIPHLVEHNEVYAYPLEGYWRDVGTIDSYWQAHMDLLDDTPELLVDDPEWPILTREPQRLPAHIHGSARIENSLIAPGCVVRGEVSHSVLGPGVVVEEGAIVRDSVIFADTRIERDATVTNAILDTTVVVSEGATLGEAGSNGKREITLVGMAVQVAKGERVAAGEHLAPPDDAEEGGS